MNVSVLVELTERLAELDAAYDLTGTLGRLKTAIVAMTNNPSDATAQENFANAHKELNDGIFVVGAYLSPADLSRLDEIGGREFFTPTMAAKIERSARDNPASPAVIKGTVEAIFQRRQNFLQYIATLNATLRNLEFEPDEVEEREAQIGITIPRKMFDNRFPDLISELNWVKTLVRQFAEIEGEDPENIHVGQISTSDPIFWLSTAEIVVIAIGSVTSWALHSWKQFEEIREIRSRTAQNENFDEKEVEAIFGEKIETLLDEKISSKAKELAKPFKGTKERKNELEGALTVLLRQFLARLERGMTVEVKLLTPPANDDGEQEEGEEQEDAGALAIEEIAKKLVFPEPSDTPILKLTHQNDDEADDGEDKKQ